MGRVGTPLPIPVPLLVTTHPRVMRRAIPRARPGAMKVMKARKVSSIAKGKKAKVAVWQGKKLKTSGGLRKENLVKSSKKKIVSAMKSQQGRNSKWSNATRQARAIKGYTGFKPIKKGTSFYEQAKEIMAGM